MTETKGFTSALIRAIFASYRWVISPFFHLLSGAAAGCRFEPTCSRYAEQALLGHGWIKGGALTVTRICRCHPFSAGGEDPVPGSTSALSKG